jgi:ABC-type multidrug transport system fused ATPase/permease subunit
LSVGQWQLLCTGRALLKGISFVEATSNVDMATDNLSQVTIQETFQLKAVLVIAHRINTILHRNKIAVMDAEFDAPSEFLAQPDSIFASLVK